MSRRYTGRPGTLVLDTTVYLAYSSRMKAFKVGMTKNVYKRMESLRTGCPDIEPVLFLRGGRELEAFLHERLREFCIGGEWFAIVSPKIVAGREDQDRIDYAKSKLTGLASEFDRLGSR